MRTAYCPKGHTELASTTAGTPYGHVPGHQYHDVDVVVSQRGNSFRCHVVESWGSAQGYDEEHGRAEAVGRGDTVVEACRDARDNGNAIWNSTDYAADAWSRAMDEAEEALA